MFCSDEIKEQLRLLPENPGSYRFLDSDSNIIYIGKAKNLKKRVESYFFKCVFIWEKMMKK